MSGDPLAPGVERQLRELVPRVLGAVVRRCSDFCAAEDAVQEALLAAVAEWPRRGVPENPGGWLFRVASRSLTDRRRSDRARREREAAIASPEDAFPPDAEDDSLLLLFTCCHPALSTSSAIALTLRAVGGLTTAEIARAFLVPEATLAQRISRAKETIRRAGARFTLPEATELRERLDAVMRVLYLIFNEGYLTGAGATLVRVDLSSEAIRLARELCRRRPDSAEAAGLLALLLLTDARRAARTGPGGELIPLAEQDRRLWDREAIAEGTALATSAMSRGEIGAYQIQAAIAALHDEAASTETTDWPQILALYGWLRRITDNPMVALNEAVAVAMVHGPAAGLTRVEEIAADPRIAGHYRLDAVRGHLHERAGDRPAAFACFAAAARGTRSLPERRYLLSKAEKLQ